MGISPVTNANPAALATPGGALQAGKVWPALGGLA